MLCSNLTNRFKVVHAAAGEVIGMAMKQMADVDKVGNGQPPMMSHNYTICELCILVVFILFTVTGAHTILIIPGIIICKDTCMQ